jgi:antitoxin HicB
VTISDLVGCTQGDTLEEAIANIQAAKIAWMEMAWEYGDEISLLSQF